MAVNAPAMSPQDSALQLKAKVELRINPKTEAFSKDLKVTVQNAVITIGGQAPSEMDAKAAERILHGISGVVGIVNNIEAKA